MLKLLKEGSFSCIQCIQCVLCCNNLGWVVHWKVLDRRDKALSNQLAVGGRGFSLDIVRLHLSHLGLESSAREMKEKTDTSHTH